MTDTAKIPHQRGLMLPQRVEAFTGEKLVASRFAALFQDQLIHTPGRGWMFYNGAYWESCGNDAMAWNAVETTCAFLIQEAADMEKEARNAVLALVRRCDSAKVTASVLDHAKRWPGIAVQDAQLDGDPDILGVRNGVIELHRGGHTFRPARPDDYLTLHGECDYDPSETCPTYDSLMELYHPEQTDREYLHRLGGAALEGRQNLQILSVWHGPLAGNGKGTTTRIWSGVFGSYAKSVPVEMLGGGNKYDQFKDEKAKLKGVRLLFTSEPPANMRFNEAVVNQITGGDDIHGRELYKSSVVFRPTWLVVMPTNNRISTNGSSGTARRIKELRWDYEISREQMNGDLETRVINTELSGVLNRLLQGWAAYSLESRIDHPESVVEATQDYLRSVDPLHQFFEDTLEWADPETSPILLKGQVYDLYSAWARNANERPLSKNRFGPALLAYSAKNNGTVEESRATGGAKVWKGLRLQD